MTCVASIPRSLDLIETSVNHTLMLSCNESVCLYQLQLAVTLEWKMLFCPNGRNPSDHSLGTIESRMRRRAVTPLDLPHLAMIVPAV